MKFNNDVVDYLKGNKFSSGIKIQLSEEENKIVSRIDYLSDLVRGKSVIHVGCVDHLQIVNEKINNNKWLHQKLTNISKNCIGLDIDREGIKFVKSRLGYDNVYYNDIINDIPLPEITNAQWDYMVLGEILEHLNNPVAFFQSIKLKYGSFVKRIIITVPNAFRLTNLVYIFKNKEFINSDHRFWFTPYTLAKLAFEGGLNVEKFQFCHSYKLSKNEVVKSFLLKKYPQLRDNLVMILNIT